MAAVAPTKALIASMMLFTGGFLPRLPEKLIEALPHTPISGTRQRSRERSAEPQQTGTTPYRSQSEAGMPSRDKEAHRGALENSGDETRRPRVRTIASRHGRNRKPRRMH